jgi:hypothetical protein
LDAPFGLTNPAPCANGLVVVLVSTADVMRADLISDGSQVGCSCFMRRAMPAICGEDIEVPDMKSKSRLWLVGGATAAMTSLPGAAMSGLRMSPPVVVDGPLDENVVTSGTSGAAATSAGVGATIAAVAPAVPA